MKQIQFFAFTLMMLMGLSFTSCLDSESESPFDGSGYYYVRGSIGTYYFEDGIGNIYYPTSSSLLEMQNSGFDFSNVKMALVYWSFVTTDGAEQPTLNVDPENPQTYNIDVVAISALETPQTISATDVAEMNQVAPETAPIYSMRAVTAYGEYVDPILYDNNTILTSMQWRTSNSEEKFKMHTINVVFIPSEFETGDTDLNLYIRHDRGDDVAEDEDKESTYLSGLVFYTNIYGINVQAAVNQFYLRTGAYPQRIVLKAKETQQLTMDLPAKYTDYNISYNRN